MQKIMLNKTKIKSEQIINVVCNALEFIDERLVSHGERVAYIIYEILNEGNLYNEFDWSKLLILSLMHDIGAYKTDEVDRLFEFDTKESLNHSIYGYLFLKILSPLGIEAAESVLYHHMNYSDLMKTKIKYREYAAIICFADRIDIYLQNNKGKKDFDFLESLRDNKFSGRYIDLFLKAEKNRDISGAILSDKYSKVIKDVENKIYTSQEEIMEYLKMIVYSIDFCSEVTVTHTIDTASISIDIARKLNVSEHELVCLYYGAFLHDIGKIAIPPSILEFPGKLSYDDMLIMKTHVLHTENIIKGLVEEEICNIAVRHHEKCNGSGYPYGLKGEELTLPERIIAVADIVSALNCKRSYKNGFNKKQILGIISDMKENNLLCAVACNVVLKDYDSIIKNAEKISKPVFNMYTGLKEDYERLLKEHENIINFKIQ